MSSSIWRSLILTTRNKKEIDAFIAEHVESGIKPQKKTVFTATYDNVYTVEVKQKAEEQRAVIAEEANPITSFQRLLSAKYTITKNVPAPVIGEVYEIVKTTKRDVGTVSNAAKVVFHLEKRTHYQVNSDVSLVVYTHDDGSYKICWESEKSAAAIQKVMRRSPVPSARLSPAPKSPSSPTSPSAAKGEWMLPNRVGFSKWMYKTFHPEKYSKPDVLFSQQRLIRDFMQFNAPFRGILLYHGLGVGKTCASIAAAEGFIERHKKVVVLVPASIAQNYKNEILRCASIGNPQAKLWSLAADVPANKDHPTVKRIMDVYGIPFSTVKRHHSHLWLPFITDGVHYSRRKVAWDTLSETDRTAINEFMMDYIESRYTFISYNGITGKGVDALGAAPFDDAFIVMDEAHNFISRVTNGGKVARRLFKLIMESKRSKMIFLSGTPVINHPFELSVLLNLIRGPMEIYSYTPQNAADANLPAAEAALVHAGVRKYIDIVRIDHETHAIEVQFLPLNFAWHGGIIKNEPWGTDESGMEERVRRALGINKKPKIKEVYALPDQKEDFIKTFFDNQDPMNPTVKNMDLFMRRILGMVSYYKTAGEEYFPSMLPRIARKIPMAGYQFSKYIDVRNEERRMEDNARRKRRPNAGDAAAGVFAKKGEVYRAFSRMACNFVFPENIKRPFPGELRKQLKQEISMNEDDEPGDEEDDAFKDDAVAKRAQKEYEVKLKEALATLKETGTPLSTSKLHDLYSPKFAAIISDIISSPGSCLLYSQFRTVEGLGILRLALEQAGFAEIDVVKHDGHWVIHDADRVMGPEFDGKRYVLFNEDREKTNILIKIFNGAFNELPPSIVDTIKSAGYSDPTKCLHGELARVIMISQSGAEGISLKNVRRVMITEPFWNKVRIDQVIGRGVRAGSHLALPADERNVQVFMYMTAFTPQQLSDNFTLQRLDNSQTSDEHIFDIAEHKSRIIDQFLTMMKRAAFDCIAHATPNGMMSSGLQCYAFPINMADDQFAYLPTLDDERRELQKSSLARTRKIQGRVVSQAGKRYVVVDGLDGLYDYRAYKDAGVLLPAATI